MKPIATALLLAVSVIAQEKPKPVPDLGGSLTTREELPFNTVVIWNNEHGGSARPSIEISRDGVVTVHLWRRLQQQWGGAKLRKVIVEPEVTWADLGLIL